MWNSHGTKILDKSMPSQEQQGARSIQASMTRWSPVDKKKGARAVVFWGIWGNKKHEKPQQLQDVQNSMPVKNRRFRGFRWKWLGDGSHWLSPAIFLSDISRRSMLLLVKQVTSLKRPVATRDVAQWELMVCLVNDGWLYITNCQPKTHMNKPFFCCNTFSQAKTISTTGHYQKCFMLWWDLPILVVYMFQHGEKCWTLKVVLVQC